MSPEQSTCEMISIRPTVTEQLTMTPLHMPLQGIVEVEDEHGELANWHNVAMAVRGRPDVCNDALVAVAGIMICWRKHYLWVLTDDVEGVYLAAQNVDGTVGHIKIPPGGKMSIGREHNQHIFRHSKDISRQHLTLHRPDDARMLIVEALSPKNPTWLLYQSDDDIS